MIVFEKVTIQNFLSYGNDSTEINLKRDNPTLISGINYDASTNGEFDSNGAGKSTILEAIAVALYDKPINIDNAKKSELVNNINKKDMLITLELKVNKEEYKIHRYYKNKAMGGNGVLIEENGKDITPDSVNNANKFISDHIMEIPYEIFGKIVVYAAGTDSFLKMGLAAQREIIEELFSYKELSNKADLLKDKIKNNKKDLEYAKESNRDIKEEYDRHVAQLEEAEQDHENWKQDQAKQISKCQKQLKELSEIDFDGELEVLKTLEKVSDEIKEYKTELREKKSELSNLNAETKKYEKAESERAMHIESSQEELKGMQIPEKELEKEKEYFSQIEEAEDELESIEAEKEKEKKDLRRINDSVKKLEKEREELKNSKCPYCSQNYKEAKEKLKEVEEEIEKHSETISNYESSIDEKDKDQKKLLKLIKNTKEKLNFNSEKEIDDYIRNKESAEKALEYYQNYKNPYEDKSDESKSIEKEIDEIEKNIRKKETELESMSEQSVFSSMDEYYSAKNKVDSLREKLEYLEEQTNPYDKILKSLNEYEPKESKDEEIDNLIDDIKHQEFLLKLLTKKDSFIRKALMDKYLPFLNERLKSYLTMMGLPHKVKFTSDLSTEISQFGKEISYALLSSGQKARVNIAISLAFRDVLQSKHNFINLFILDECLDVGLSNVGVKKTLKVIKEVAKNNKLSMFIISHRDEIKDAFKDRLEIEMRNGFSSVN